MRLASIHRFMTMIIPNGTGLMARCVTTGRKMGVKIRDYTVAPIYLDATGKGGHEWLIEFEDHVPDLEAFSNILDKYLQEINSDYEAKRYGDMALQRLTAQALPKGTFARWLKHKGKVGAQIKVPRLSNKRDLVEEVLALTQNSAPA